METATYKGLRIYFTESLNGKVKAVVLGRNKATIGAVYSYDYQSTLDEMKKQIDAFRERMCPKDDWPNIGCDKCGYINHKGNEVCSKCGKKL